MRGEIWDVVVDVSRQPEQFRSAVTALSDQAAFFVFVSSGKVYADHRQVGQDEGNPQLPAGFGPGRSLIARPEWPLDQGVERWMGDQDWADFNAQDASRARAAGLVTQTLADTRAWELTPGAGAGSDDRPVRFR